MVRVGHSMGYELEGCIKDIEGIIGAQGGKMVLNEYFIYKCSRNWPQVQKGVDKGAYFKTSGDFSCHSRNETLNMLTRWMSNICGETRIIIMFVVIQMEVREVFFVYGRNLCFRKKM